MNATPNNEKRPGGRTPDRFGFVPLERGFAEQPKATAPTPIDKMRLALEPYAVHSHGSGWRARCPVQGHGKGEGDCHPSLHFEDGADGRVLIRCQAGCNTEDVLTAVGLTFSDLYPEHTAPRQWDTAARHARLSSSSPVPAPAVRFHPVSGWELVTVFPFNSADGVVIATKARYERTERSEAGVERRGKTFRSAGVAHTWPERVERGEPKGESGIELPLYRLPDLVAMVKGGGPVYMTEGEAKADAVACCSHHLPPGCSVTSYGGHWRRDHAHVLRGTGLVVLLPDADAVGRNKARSVRDHLRAAGVPCVIAPSVVEYLGGLVGMTETPGGDDATQRQPNDFLDLSSEQQTAYLAHVGHLAENYTEPFDGAPFDDEVVYGESDREREIVDLLPTLCAADVTPEPVNWFWPAYIPRGTLTLLEGAGGHGKSTLTASLIAALTAGVNFPDGTRCDEGGAVLMLAAEDDEAYTIVPRLLAAGAALDYVRIVDETALMQSGLTFPKDAEKLASTIREYGVRLVIIDPIFSYTGKGIDTNNDASARQMLTALQRIARETGAAIIAVRHFKKGTAGSATERGGGSVAFSNAARSVLQVWKERDVGGEETGRFVLARSKGNLSAPPPSLVYTLESVSVESENGSVETSRVVWHGAIAVTAEELSTADRASMQGTSGEDDSSALADGIEFLREELRDGPVASTEMQSRARAAGVKWRTVERAKKELGIESRREGTGWFFHLPREETGEE